MFERLSLVDQSGVYGGRTSRDEVLRNLKEALALVENTAPDAVLGFSGLRIDVLDPGTPAESR